MTKLLRSCRVPKFVPKRRYWITTIRCVISQNIADLKLYDHHGDIKTVQFRNISFPERHRQAPPIFMLPVCPFTTPLQPATHRSLLHQTMSNLHAIISQTFEGHLYAFSFSPHQTAITTWRAHSKLPSVWRFGVPEWSHVYQLKSLVCGTCTLSAQYSTFLTQLHREFWFTLYTKPGYRNTFHLQCLNH